MAKAKLACWNIYFSWTLVETRAGQLRIVPKQRRRAQNVAKIIGEVDADLLGIVECMSLQELEFFRDEKCPDYDGIVVEGRHQNYNLGLLYKKSVLKVTKVAIDTDDWKAKIGNDRSEVTYKFTRTPLVVSVEDKHSGRAILLAIVHPKSKRPSNGLSSEERTKEAIKNRKRIVAEGLRLRELLLAKVHAGNTKYNRWMIMGDINDGPDFDRYEAQILRSGVEAHIGTVLEPERLLHSFVDLSDGKGQPSSSFAKGSVQLDHILYDHEVAHGRGKPRAVKGSGKVRSDLVNIKRDGKKRDSDHAPVEVVIDF